MPRRATDGVRRTCSRRPARVSDLIPRHRAPTPARPHTGSDVKNRLSPPHEHVIRLTFPRDPDPPSPVHLQSPQKTGHQRCPPGTRLGRQRGHVRPRQLQLSPLRQRHRQGTQAETTEKNKAAVPIPRLGRAGDVHEELRSDVPRQGDRKGVPGRDIQVRRRAGRRRARQAKVPSADPRVGATTQPAPIQSRLRRTKTQGRTVPTHGTHVKRSDADVHTTAGADGHRRAEARGDGPRRRSRHQSRGPRG